ncbi:MAG TPA: hypothetical protein VGG72_27050 [Bryobacteraceae bacterium]|jgi:hypothetical protein
MKKRSIVPALAAIVGVLVLLSLFVAFRARTFHYCVEDGERPQVHVTGDDEPCGPDEGPIEWDSMGLPSRFRLLRDTAAKAFGAN